MKFIISVNAKKCPKIMFSFFDMWLEGRGWKIMAFGDVS